jgi:hypothetical protein
MSSLLASIPRTYPASLLLNFDGANNSTTFTDSSIYSHSGTVYGTAKISTAQSKFDNSSGYFDSSGDYVQYPTNAAFGFGTGSFTIEFWLYMISEGGTQGIISIGDYTNGILFRHQPTTDSFYINGTSYNWYSSTNCPISQWNHIAITRENGNFSIYVNGFRILSGYNNSDLGSTRNVTIGASSHNTGEGLNGYIDSLRVTKGSALYTGQSFVLPNSPPSKNATIAPKLYNHIVMTSTKSSGDITGSVSTSTGYYTVNWWDGTKTTYASGASFAKAAIGGNQSITIYPSSSNGSLDGYFYNVDVSNNNLTSVRPFYSRFIVGPATPGYSQYGYVGYPYYYSRWNWIPGIPGAEYQLNISYNSLDSSALNQVYTDLLNGNGSINVSDNTGGDSDNPSIATTKGYTVYGSLAPILSALFNFDGTNNSTTFTDSSSYNHVPTRYGNTVISTAQSKFGGASAYFDGTGDYLDVATNSVFAMGYEDFTAECWVRPTSFPTSDLGAIIETRSSASSGGFLLWLGSDQKWVLYTSANSNGTQRSVSSIDNATLNVWTHLSAVRKNGKLYLFVNGSLVGTAGTEGDPDDLSPSNTTSMKMGTAIDSPGSTRMFYGYMDGVKIVKGKALYSDDFVVPSSAPTTSTASVATGVTRLLLNCNGSNNSTTFTDSSSDARTVTRTNTVISTTQSKFGGSSAYFSNSGTDALAVTNTFNLSECDWTVEFFFYLINLTGMTGNPRLFSIEKSGESWGILLYDSAPARFASWNRFGTGSSVEMYDYINSSNRQEISLTTWHHFAMTKDNNTYRMFFNGYQIGMKAESSYTPSGNVVLTIGGCRLNYQYNKLNAYMDDFRVITGKALYTSNFTPPTSQLVVYP